jgi:hypothetical protein
MRPPAAQVLGSGAASSSRRLDTGASVSQSQSQGLLLSRLYHQDVEIDALVRLEVRTRRRATPGMLDR